MVQESIANDDPDTSAAPREVRPVTGPASRETVRTATALVQHALPARSVVRFGEQTEIHVPRQRIDMLPLSVAELSSGSPETLPVPSKASDLAPEGCREARGEERRPTWRRAGGCSGTRSGRSRLAPQGGTQCGGWIGEWWGGGGKGGGGRRWLGRWVG